MFESIKNPAVSFGRSVKNAAVSFGRSVKNVAGEAVECVKENAGKALAFGAGLLGLAAAPKSEAAIITYDSATNGVTFTPGELVSPIVTGVIAAVAATSVLVVIALGVRWLYRMLKGAK